MMINYGSKHHHHHESCQPSADRGRRGAQVERKVGREVVKGDDESCQPS